MASCILPTSIVLHLALLSIVLDTEMTSLLSQYPVLVLLYRDANEAGALETKSAEFWHAYLRCAFSDLQRYHVAQEISPDGSLRRVDIVVKEFDSNNNTLSALLWVECKLPGGDVRRAEEQALNAATRNIEKDDLEFIYVMTTVGTTFRLWRVTRPGQHLRDWRLEPMFGNDVRADRREYIGFESPEVWRLDVALEEIRQRKPLRAAPIIPSQPAAYTQWQQAYQQAESSQQQQAYQQQYVTAQQGEGDEHGDSDEADSSTARSKEVQVTKKSHALRRTEFIYRDAKGRQRSTSEEDWQQDQHGTKYIHGKKFTYYCYARNWPR